jgi:hypothetical protein
MKKLFLDFMTNLVSALVVIGIVLFCLAVNWVVFL